MNIIVKLEAFEGPFDLLLALIQKHEIDIYDIPISKLAAQYIEALNNMPGDMEQMSRFVLMAATLLEIKSRMLLPKPPAPEDEAEDPREELVRRLEEYKYFKEAAEMFRERSVYGAGLVYKKSEALFSGIKSEEKDVSGLLRDVTLERLFEIFSGVLSRSMKKTNVGVSDIKKDTYSPEDKLVYLSGLLSVAGRLSFLDILNACLCREEQVCTFLALLELIRMGQASVVQEDAFGEIYCEHIY